MFQNKLRFILFFTVSVIFILSSCTEDNDQLGPENEEFVGTYMSRDLTLTENFILFDSVRFSIVQNTTYRMDFYELITGRDSIAFCDHGGTLLDFGTAKVSFDSTIFPNGSCDNLSLPRATFVADFINFADTIVITKQVTDDNASPPYDSIFVLKLIK